jgi:hypothetical protein
MVQHLHLFATGRAAESPDQLAHLQRAFQRTGARFEALILALVGDEHFLGRVEEDE